MNPFIDLHCHTTLSDGEYSPDEVCGRAQAGGVGTLAITDHNFNNPDLDALRAAILADGRRAKELAAERDGR